MYSRSQSRATVHWRMMTAVSFHLAANTQGPLVRIQSSTSLCKKNSLCLRRQWQWLYKTIVFWTDTLQVSVSGARRSGSEFDATKTIQHSSNFAQNWSSPLRVTSPYLIRHHSWMWQQNCRRTSPRSINYRRLSNPNNDYFRLILRPSGFPEYVGWYYPFGGRLRLHLQNETPKRLPDYTV